MCEEVALKLKLSKKERRKYTQPLPKKVEDCGDGFDFVSSSSVRSDDSFQNLRSYQSIDEVRESLRQIPTDLAEALQVVPELFLDATCKLHGRMSHWSTRLAYARATYTAAKLAREVGLERQKHVVRDVASVAGGKAVSETLITSRAKASDEYSALCLCEVDAERDYLRIRALVDTISTKKAALRILSFYTKPEMDAAKVAYITEDD
jgi:hypothetical protein